MGQDEEKLHLEKIEIEREMREVEKEHFDRQQKTELIKTIITAFSILIPLLIALLMINSNFKIDDMRIFQRKSQNPISY